MASSSKSSATGTTGHDSARQESARQFREQVLGSRLSPRLSHWRDQARDYARDGLAALRQDLDEVRHAAHQLRQKSHLLSFLNVVASAQPAAKESAAKPSAVKQAGAEHPATGVKQDQAAAADTEAPHTLAGWSPWPAQQDDELDEEADEQLRDLVPH